MFLILRDDGDGEVLIAATDAEDRVSEIVAEDVARRFPAEDANQAFLTEADSEKWARRRYDFIVAALHKHACEYKMLLMT